MTIARCFLSWHFTPRYSLKTARDLRYEFLETPARSEKAHFCLKLSENETKLSKSNPVAEVRECH